MATAVESPKGINAPTEKGNSVDSLHVVFYSLVFYSKEAVLQLDGTSPSQFFTKAAGKKRPNRRTIRSQITAAKSIASKQGKVAVDEDDIVQVQLESQQKDLKKQSKCSEFL